VFLDPNFHNFHSSLRNRFEPSSILMPSLSYPVNSLELPNPKSQSPRPSPRDPPEGPYPLFNEYGAPVPFGAFAPLQSFPPSPSRMQPYGVAPGPVFRPPVMNLAFPPRSPILNFSYKPPRLVSFPYESMYPPVSPSNAAVFSPINSSQIEAHLGDLLEVMGPAETAASGEILLPPPPPLPFSDVVVNFPFFIIIDLIGAHAELRRCLWLGNALRRLFRAPCDSTLAGTVFGVPHDWNHAANFGGRQLIAFWDSETTVTRKTNAKHSLLSFFFCFFFNVFENNKMFRV